MSWLNYHHLLYFRVIAQEGSISRASEKLNVGQPALSAQLKTFEEALDRKLFERKNRRLYLTDSGKLVLQYANQINELGLELLDTLKSNRPQMKRHLNLGAMDSVPKNLLIHIIEETRKHEESLITINEGPGEELYRQLMSHEVDVVISDHNFVPDTDRSVYSKSLGRFKIGVFGSPRFVDLKKKFPRSLENQPIILSTSHSKLRHDIERFFESQKISINIVMSTQDTSIHKLLAEDGQGLIFEPAFAVKSLLVEKKLNCLGYIPNLSVEYHLSSTQKFIENPLVTYLFEQYKFKRPKTEYHR